MGVVEDKGSVAVDRLRNPVPRAPGPGIGVVTAMVAAASRGWIFPGWLNVFHQTSVLFWRNIHRKGPGVAGVAGARPACWFFARLIWPVATRQKMASCHIAPRRVGWEGLACQEADLLHQLLILIRHDRRDSRLVIFEG